MWRWLRDNVDPITSAAAIFGTVVGVIGFGITFIQLQQANTSLRAGNVYQIQKDARENLEKLLGDKHFRDVINGRAPADDASQDSLWLMFNFYRSVHRQAVAGGLTDEYVTSIAEDFCGFLKLEPVDAGWKKLQTEERIGDGHAQMRREWCGT